MENITKKCIDTSDTNDCIKLQKIIDTNIDDVLKKDNSNIKNYINGFINKKRGIKNENKIISQYSEKYKTKVTDNNSKLYKIHLFNINKYNIIFVVKLMV